MTTASQRIPVLVTGPEKARIGKAAKAAGLSMGEYLRRAASAFRPSEQDAALDGLIGQVLGTTTRANQAIDKALRSIAESNKRIAALERAHQQKATA